MLQFTDIDELNQYLAEKKEDGSVFIKSIKTVCVNAIPNFFVLVDEKFNNPNSRPMYNPRSFQ
jgi:hypothetical protein